MSPLTRGELAAMLAALMRHQGLALDDPEVAALQEATRPEVLVPQLEQALEPPIEEEPGSLPRPPQAS